MSMLPRQAGVTRVVSAAAVLTLALVGCADEPAEVEWPDIPSAEPAAEQPETPGNPAEAEATEEILTLVHEFREVEVASYADPRPPHLMTRELDDHLADPLLIQIVETLEDMHEAGIVFEGQPNWDPTVVELRLDDTPPTATVRDCVDASDWRSVFRETGAPVPDERPDRYVEEFQVMLYPDGWLIYQAGVKGDAKC